jgi:hypothetical protein
LIQLFINAALSSVATPGEVAALKSEGAPKWAVRGFDIERIRAELIRVERRRRGFEEND